jgi:hypothetical protein
MSGQAKANILMIAYACDPRKSIWLRKPSVKHSLHQADVLAFPALA